MTKIVNWIWKAPTLEERLRRIEEFLPNEGYSLPAPPRGVDRSERGEKHIVYGEVWTVEYSVLDQTGRKVYHYREREINHIMLGRIEAGDSWAIEYLPRIPAIRCIGEAPMRKALRFRYEKNQGYFSLLWEDYDGSETGHDTRHYSYLFFPIRDLTTGEIIGFCDSGGELPKDYLRIMQLLREHPIHERYDVPELGLVDVTVDQILTAIYEQYVPAPRWEKLPIPLEVAHPA